MPHEIVHRALLRAMSDGSWLFIQNVHLHAEFIFELVTRVVQRAVRRNPAAAVVMSRAGAGVASLGVDDSPEKKKARSGRSGARGAGEGSGGGGGGGRKRKSASPSPSKEQAGGGASTRVAGGFRLWLSSDMHVPLPELLVRSTVKVEGSRARACVPLP